MGTIDRLIRERDEADNEPLEYVGAASDDVSKYMPLASGVLSELVTNQLKSNETSQAAAQFAASPAGQAQAAAKDLTLKAQLAQADALGETDLNGPKHKAAADLATQAQSAQAKAAVYGAQTSLTPGATTPTGMTPGGHGQGGGSFFSKYKVPLLIGGGVGILGLIVLIVKRK